VHGVSAYATLIEQNMAQAAHLEGLVRDHPKLELLAPRAMNVVCFRYCPAGVDNAALNRLNRRLVVDLQESGLYVVSGTLLDDHYAIRVANTNHRSRMDDFDALVADVVAFGDRLAARELAAREEDR
jgi:glutamate/tyrosine decarboxylase-like PLP-dependent enzyme